MTPRVIDILTIFDKKGINDVKEYLNHSDMVIDVSSWAFQIKKTLDENNLNSASMQIALVGYKFKKNAK